MSKWVLQLQKIGRDKINKNMIVEGDTLPQAENRAIRECKKHLASKSVTLTHIGDLIYLVKAGLQTVGGVSIHILTPQEKKS